MNFLPSCIFNPRMQLQLSDVWWECCWCSVSECLCLCVWYSCGDAVCTIASSTTFSEPFVTSMDRRRLDSVHRSLAGTRCSDHVALLHAFQLWEDARFVVLSDW